MPSSMDSNTKVIRKEILSLAAPSIVSNITTPLLGLVDTAITGHMGAPAYLGAIAIGGSMFSLAYWLMNFLRISTSGLTAQAFGMSTQSGGHHQAYVILWRSLIISTVISILIILFSKHICSALLYFMDADTVTSALAREYFLILIFGAPAVLGTFALTGWMLGMQDSKSPMWMSIIINIANIVLSLILVYAFRMKITGVAIGTLVAQWIGFIAGLLIAHSKYSIFTHIGHIYTLLTDWRRFFSLNFDIFLRTLCLVAVTLWFTRAGSSQSDLILAANALLMQLFILFSYFMDGFAFAGEAMAGKYYGAKNNQMLISTVKGIFHFGIIVTIIFTLIYALCGDIILEILSDSEEIVDVAKTYLPWACLVPVCGFAAFVWDGIFIGLTYTRKMLLSMVGATAIYFVLYFMLSPHFGNHGLWVAFLSYLILRGCIETILFPFKDFS